MLFSWYNNSIQKTKISFKEYTIMNDLMFLVTSILGLILTLGASIWTRIAFSAYRNTQPSRFVTPEQLAQEIIQGEGLKVSLTFIPGALTDHYDPYKKIVAIGEETARESGMSQLTVTAHEFGHALQDKSGLIFFKIRNLIAPIVGIGTNIGYFLFIIGLTLALLDLAIVGLALFSLTTIFMLITLPIEIDASVRAMKLLRKYNVISDREAGPARNLLSAAASTYIAGFVQSFIQLIYFISLLTNSRRE